MTGRVRSDEGFRTNRASAFNVYRVHEYWRYSGTPCEYVPSLMLHPWHIELRWNRLNYFFYWRQRVFEGECLDTDAGYVWLHALELLTVNDDPAENHECLVRMRDAYKGQNELVDRILGASCSCLEAAAGMEIEDAEDLDRDCRTIRICRILSNDRFVPLSPNDMRFLTGFKGKNIDMYASAASAIVSAALHVIGRSRYGCGILKMCERHTRIALEVPCKDSVPDRIGPLVTLSCADLRRSNEFIALVKSLYRSCILRLSGKSDALEEVVYAYREALEICIRAWKEGRLEEVAKPYRKTGAPENVESDRSPSPAKAPYHRKDGTWPSYRFKARMKEYESVRMPYTASTSADMRYAPSYSRMTLAEFAEYQAWRDAALRGDEREGCPGFVWLFANEVLHDDAMDPGTALSALNICLRCSSDSRAPWVCSLIVDWCLMNDMGLELEEPLYDQTRANAVLTQALTSRPPGRICRNLINRYSTGEREPDPDAVNASLRAIWRAKGGSFAGYFGTEVTSSYIGSFAECAGMPASIAVQTFSDMEGATAFLKRVCAMVAKAMEGGPRPHASQWIDAETRDIIVEATRAVKKRKSELVARSRMAKADLDMEAVSSAYDDLNAVTSMMATEREEARPEPAMAAAERPSTGDPWADFAARLSPEHVEYLRGCIDGRRTDRKLEKAVNEAAMDTVGDVVVSDGNAVEDYAEQLGAIVSGHL